MIIIGMLFSSVLFASGCFSIINLKLELNASHFAITRDQSLIDSLVAQCLFYLLCVLAISSPSVVAFVHVRLV